MWELPDTCEKLGILLVAGEVLLRALEVIAPDNKLVRVLRAVLNPHYCPADDLILVYLHWAV